MKKPRKTREKKFSKKEITYTNPITNETETQYIDGKIPEFKATTKSMQEAYDNDWKSSQEMLYYLIDIASKGGNYLLNIGPDGKGHVPEASAKGLRDIGTWLKTNGDAIYGTTKWKIPHEGQEESLLKGTEHRAKAGFERTFFSEEFWFTTKENPSEEKSSSAYKLPSFFRNVICLLLGIIPLF